MTTEHIEEIELLPVWGEGDPRMSGRAAFPLHAAHGCEASSTVYFEVEPGHHIGRHTDSAEEILFIVDGTGEAVVGDERVPVSRGALALVPELVPHDVYATGDSPLRVLGFFAAATVESVFDETMQPMDRRVLGTPVAEVTA
jgi:mannose-6-phosphate isomerase-like protein (cupin superfamily)